MFSALLGSYQNWRDFTCLAIPILIAELLHLTPAVVDTIMAGHYSAADLAGVSVGGGLLFSIILLHTGIVMATTPSVAQLYGAKQYSRIGFVVQQSLWLALYSSLVGVLIVYGITYLLGMIDISPATRPVAIGYLGAAVWSLPAITIMQSLRSFSEGMSITRPLVYFGLLAVAINIPMNYVLIYGHFGFPELGGVGCGWATTISTWTSLMGMAIYIYWRPVYRPSQFFDKFSLPQWQLIKALLKVGLPIGTSIFIEATMFSVISLFLAAQPETILASHQLVLNFCSFLFMVPLSIGIAATISVGQSIGSGDHQAAKINTAITYIMAMGIAIIYSVIMLSWPEYIARIYSEDTQVTALAMQLLFFAALFQLSDALQVSSTGILRGFKDTRWPMLVVIIAYWLIGMPLGYTLGLTDIIVPAMGAVGFWVGLIAGLTFAGIFLFIRVIKVISSINSTSSHV